MKLPEITDFKSGVKALYAILSGFVALILIGYGFGYWTAKLVYLQENIELERKQIVDIKEMQKTNSMENQGLKDKFDALKKIADECDLQNKTYQLELQNGRFKK